MSRTARDVRSKRFHLGSASSRWTGDVLAILAGDVPPVPHDSARLLKNLSSVVRLRSRDTLAAANLRLAEALAEAGRALPAGHLARLGATPHFPGLESSDSSKGMPCFPDDTCS